MQDREGKTALMHAAANGHDVVISTILSKSHPSLNIKESKNGMTALMLAAAAGYQKVGPHGLLTVLLVAHVGCNGRPIKLCCRVTNGLGRIIGGSCWLQRQATKRLVLLCYS